MGLHKGDCPLLVSKGETLVQVHGGTRMVVRCPEARDSALVMGVLGEREGSPGWWCIGQTMLGA